MKKHTIYGIKSSAKDEKIIVQRVNDYLKTLDRTMSKTKSKSMLEARLPFVLKYFYWNLNKGTGTWFELFRNEDIEGKYYNNSNKECGWILKTRIDLTHPCYEKNKTENFLLDILKSIEFEIITIKESDTDLE
ncbi:hypothetical protein BW723_14555 [Polaribacter reichenbachii]|uniref:Uncharacterized protein n=1 Tax=Polaribacter reichenbachii TaxID=996801 RepID=A0A1B8U480_9FLAO|nr:hypothetical protein [Polaribacter reichenbachii]APZ47431.1 hypothetical protein BW723_14555 [Polaribacter reichenbachii]AUC18069.1 hypothetical protein BTO17_04995 [Polaribacter reichenbachii]OBY66680.1 hypothetical protein LPB301_05625 [Polaribacter reichenbachii]